MGSPTTGPGLEPLRHRRNRGRSRLRAPTIQNVCTGGIVVPDDKLIRRKRPSPKEDSVKVQIGGGKAMIAAPGTRGFPPRVTGRPKWMEVADSRIPGGFVVELSIPLKKIPGWSRSLAGVSISYTVRDADGVGPTKARSSRTRYHFSEANALLTSFLRAAGITKRSIRLDILRDVNLGKGRDRVVFGGTVIGVLTDKYIFMKLPVADATDVVAVKVINFSGTGRSQILAHYKQHGNGTREMVSVWSIDGNSRFQKLVSVEIAKERAGQQINNTWSLVRAGSTRAKTRTAKRGYDLVIEATEAVGFNAENYREMRASDADAILLPWSEETNRVYFFEGDDLGGHEAMDPKVAAKRAKARAKANKKKR